MFTKIAEPDRLQKEKWIKVVENPTLEGPIQLAGVRGVPTHRPLLEQNDYPLWIITGPNHQFLNSSFANVVRLKALEGNPVVYMNNQDAAERKIEDGDLVRLYNDRGECFIFASVGLSVLPGVTVTQGLWWEDPELGISSINVLPPDRLADMGGGATFFSTRIEIEKYKKDFC